LSYQGSTYKRTEIQAGLGIMQNPISKITKIKKARGVSQVVEHLHRKCNAEFNPQLLKKGKAKVWWS
jgi:hypothetical protein